MTNRLAIILTVLIIGFFVLDHYVLQMDALKFLFRKFLELLQAVAFWR